ncbi:MAG TPA: lanthionine synthetase LanC family protein, partial [Solirubrobacteraceae bacterium]|nr:lanthionine synthetase LanC family protein [Solirubrobacteraceae bacterium]
VWTCRAAPGWEVHAAAAEVHRARGDRTAHARAVGGFVAACGGGSEGVTAAARLLDGAEDEVARALLTAWLRRALDDLWRSDPGELPHLGMAHGRAGVLYATLHACRSAGFPRPPGLEACLDGLAALAEPSGRGVRWPGTLALPGVTARTPSLAPGWCAGSAGHAILFALAYEELGDDRFLTLAERAGDYAIDHPATDPDLCCGLTGRAFALLRLHQVTGDESRLSAAQRLAGAAAAGWAGREAAPTLRRGPLGTALLLVELEAPEHAQVPNPAG